MQSSKSLSRSVSLLRSRDFLYHARLRGAMPLPKAIPSFHTCRSHRPGYAVCLVVGRDLVLRVEAVDHEGHHQSRAISKIKNTQHFAESQQQGIEQHYVTG